MINLKPPWHILPSSLKHLLTTLFHTTFLVWIPHPGIHLIKPENNHFPFQCRCRCSYLEYTIPPSTHYGPHHFFPYKTIFLCLQMYRSSCRLLLEIRLNFSTSPYPSENSPIQYQEWIYTQTISYRHTSLTPSPSLPLSTTSTPLLNHKTCHYFNTKTIQ